MDVGCYFYTSCLVGVVWSGSVIGVMLKSICSYFFVNIIDIVNIVNIVVLLLIAKMTPDLRLQSLASSSSLVIWFTWLRGENKQGYEFV